MSNLSMYEPCPCGSGKKIKFCCYLKGKELSVLSDRELILRASQLPVATECLINTGWQEQGLAQILVIRHLLNRRFIAGVYLVDIFCLGLKDSFIRLRLNDKDVNSLREKFGVPLEEIPYEDVRSIIFGAIDYAKGLGFDAKDDGTLDQCLEFVERGRPFEKKFTFGQDGKPLYINGPKDDVSSIMKTLEPFLAAKRADYLIGLNESSKDRSKEIYGTND